MLPTSSAIAAAAAPHRVGLSWPEAALRQAAEGIAEELAHGTGPCRGLQLRDGVLRFLGSKAHPDERALHHRSWLLARIALSLAKANLLFDVLLPEDLLCSMPIMRAAAQPDIRGGPLATLRSRLAMIEL